jgi:predicted NACHT family NTPase
LNYHWQRLWVPRSVTRPQGGSEYPATRDDVGQSSDHTGEVPLEALLNIPCLVLLGEPGIGKTRALKGAQTHAQGLNRETLWFELGGYQSDELLCKSLFGDSTFQDWLDGTHHLDLFLDSFDEGRLTIRVLAALLARELKKYRKHLQLLSLRITCRSSEWPWSLEEHLNELWGEQYVCIYELTSLRPIDIVEAAVANGLDPDAFMREIDRKVAMPLAIKPLTLDFLLKLYQEKGTFPSTQAELYAEGCEILCRTIGTFRQETGLTGALSAMQRLRVAARIAALSTIANCFAISFEENSTAIFPGEIAVRELCGGSEHVNGGELPVAEAVIREVLTTGLFSAHHTNRLEWAHRTYAEFLAAYYLVQYDVPPSQAMSFFSHKSDSEGMFVPQLHETLAWLVTMRNDVFREVMKIEPEVLLRSDVATAEEKDRADLVKALLQLPERGRLLHLHRNMKGAYKKLAHSELVAQLRPYVTDRGFGEITRIVAISIAAACQVHALQHDLVQVALDRLQPPDMRVDAAYAVVHIGDEATKAQLKRLATEGREDDPDDELKGCALQATWPHYMTAEELFAVLTPPKRPDFFGGYRRFLSSQPMRHLLSADLPLALRWVETHPAQIHLQHISGLNEIADMIIEQAWEHLEDPDIRETFTRAVLSRIGHQDAIISNPQSYLYQVIGSDDEKRRNVLDAIFHMCADTGQDHLTIWYSQPQLLMSKDFPWLVTYIQQAEAVALQRIAAQLIQRMIDINDPDKMMLVFDATERCPVLAAELAYLLKPIALDSPQAQKMKEEYLKYRQWQEEDQAVASFVLDPPPGQRIAMLLDECERGNFGAWWRLCMEMTLRPDSTHYKSELELEPDITLLPGWKQANLETRTRIIATAKAYVEQQDPELAQWLGKPVFHRPAFALYKALRLLVRHAPDIAEILSIDVWKKVAPVILVYPSSERSPLEQEQLFVRLAYLCAPEEIIATLLALLATDNDYECVYTLQKAQLCWDDRLAAAFLRKAMEETLKPSSMAHLLRELLDHDVERAKEFAQHLVASVFAVGERERARAIEAAKVLLTHADDAGWPTIWPAIQQDTAFAYSIFSAMANGYNSKRHFPGQLTEHQVADLYIWMVRHYPPALYPVQFENSIVGASDSIALWRDSLLIHLKERGTFQAHDAIKYIQREAPEVDPVTIGWALTEVQQLARRNTWEPYFPADILSVIHNPRLRLVQTGEQLLEVLIEALLKIEEKLRGETPAVAFLWNEPTEKGKTEYSPKDENSFSNCVKFFLEDYLKPHKIIVNREVEIRRGEGSTPGERTDIHVDAFVQRPGQQEADHIIVIIEAKGCWNPALTTAMEIQLVQRYMRENPAAYGLYLVGWFYCDQWKEKRPLYSMHDLQEQLDTQAAQLSQQGRCVRALVMNTSLRSQEKKHAKDS